jgi:hypothetical protein
MGHFNLTTSRSHLNVTNSILRHVHLTNSMSHFNVTNSKESELNESSKSHKLDESSTCHKFDTNIEQITNLIRHLNLTNSMRHLSVTNLISHLNVTNSMRHQHQTNHALNHSCKFHKICVNITKSIIHLISRTQGVFYLSRTQLQRDICVDVSLSSTVMAP